MTFMSWILGAWLAVTCLSVAVPVWKRAGQPSGPGRRSLLAGLMEAASLAGLLRLVVPWGSGAVALWVVAVVALAAAVAGAVLRWPVLPGRPSAGAGAAESAATPELLSSSAANMPGKDIATAEAGAGAAALSKSPQPFLLGQETPYASNIGQHRRTAKARKKKPKKEPGNLALAGNAALLLAVVVVSVLAG